MLKLRNLLFFLFAITSMFPLAAIGTWTYFQITNNEQEDVRDKHLLLARNLGAALSRYHHDVSALFDMLAADLSRTGEAGSAADLLGSLGLRDICVVDMASGAVVAGIAAEGLSCPQTVPAERRSMLAGMTTTGSTVISPVVAGPDGAPLLLLLRMSGDKLAIGSLNTDYFTRLGKTVTFGANGHATIVDQEGNILAHPLDEWVASRRNIGELSVVQRMMKGETGIGTFYSPALKGDMMAGFASVPGPGWGVMIPQPVSELHARAAMTQNSFIALALLGLVIITVLSIAIARHVSLPLERIMQAVRQTNETSTPTDTEMAEGWLIPRELSMVQASFNDMAAKLREKLADIRYLAFTDAVTGLPNREAFRVLSSTEIERMRKKATRGSLLFIDLDDFKGVNDTLGHDMGDELLRTVSHLLADAVHAATGQHAKTWPHSCELSQVVADGAPVIGRDGGDEFTIFVPGIGEADQLLDVLTAVKARLSTPIKIGDEHLSISASIGAARFPKDGESFAVLRKRADIAMYHAKRQGKNNFQIYGFEIGDVTVAETRRAVSQGLKNGEFVLFYQPKVNARKARVEGAEALIRWAHPQRGMLQPHAFIPATENSDVIIELGEWVVRAAAQHINELRHNGVMTRVAVNISARQFCAPGFVDTIRAIIAETGIDPASLELEITEEAVLSNLRATQKAIRELQELKVRIALDDFGRGYSNLTRVADLAVDIIKIDGPLTARVTSEDRVRVIIGSAVEMAHGLGCETIAEGVETAEQAACLVQLGCDQLQGYHFAKPMAFRALLGWIKSYERPGLGDANGFPHERIKQIA